MALFLQESLEAFPCSEPVFVLAGLPSVHGLYDLSVFPHGFLVVNHYLEQHSHLSPGKAE